MNLSTNDYKKIVEFYNIKKNKNQSYKYVAEKTLANKLCRCIKKVKKNMKTTEKRAISVCRKSIFLNRNIDFYNFKCKKKEELLSQKTKNNGKTKKYLKKNTKKISFNTTKKK
jgi:hypothetical protein